MQRQRSFEGSANLPSQRAQNHQIILLLSLLCAFILTKPSLIPLYQCSIKNKSVTIKYFLSKTHGPKIQSCLVNFTTSLAYSSIQNESFTYSISWQLILLYIFRYFTCLAFSICHPEQRRLTEDLWGCFERSLQVICDRVPNCFN